MNHDDTYSGGPDQARGSRDGRANGGDAQLRWQLRGLRRDMPPARDLWPQIATRIAVMPVSTHGPVQPQHHSEMRHRVMRRMTPWALAASLVLAIGLAWQLRPLPAPAIATDVATDAPAAGIAPTRASDQSPSGPASLGLLHREADAMTREYSAALRELRSTIPTSATPTAEAATLRTLDRSAAQIRTAMARDPDARFLLERLRRTYAQRLALTQRAVMT